MFNWFRRKTLLPEIHHPEFLSVLPFGARVACCLGLGSWLRLPLRFQFAFQMHALPCNTHQMLPCMPKLLPYIHHNHENPFLCNPPPVSNEQLGP